MDLKDTSNKDELIKNINSLTNELKNFLAAELSYGNERYKKAALIYYWLRDYKNYLKNEKKFNAKYLPAYERGSIVKVNLGFNIGTEFGGMHYAVVLSNSSKTNPNLIVLPLKSFKEGRKIHSKSEIFLGTELYNRLLGKKTALHISLDNEIKDLENNRDKLYERLMLLQELEKTSGSTEQVKNLIRAASEDMTALENKLIRCNEHTARLELVWNELSKTNKGSIALVSQITNISKMRVINPCNSNDVLYGIKLPEESLNAIDNKILEIYTKKHLT